MLRSLISLVFALLPGFVLAQSCKPVSMEARQINACDSEGDIEVISKGDGKAELVIRHFRQQIPRPAGSLYCLAKIGEGWPGRGDGTFVVSAMPCGVVKDGVVKIAFSWPKYRQGLVQTIAYDPLTVEPDKNGKIFAWERDPSPQGGGHTTRFVSRITKHQEQVIALQLEASGRVRYATSAEAEKITD